MKTKIIFIVSVMLLATSALASPKKKTFDGTQDAVFDATVRAARSNWTVKFADRATGTITFTTGVSVATWGMECSVALQQTSVGKIEVTVKTQKKAQIYAWSAGDRIADKLFKSIEKELAPTPAPTPSAGKKE